MSDLKKWSPVVVEWEDAFSTFGSNYSKAYVKFYKPVIRRSIGFLLEKNSRYVHITATDDRAIKDHEDCDDILTVPIAMVRSVTLLVPEQTLVPVEPNIPS